MPFRFRRSVRLFPGVRLNLSKSGMSVSVGGPGATLNLSRRGHSVTVGLPGTGLSYRHQLTSPRQTQADGRHDAGLRAPALTPYPVPDAAPPVTSDPTPLAGEIRSAEVAGLTTPDLQGLKQLINEAAAQKASLKLDLAAALASREQAWRKLRRREQMPLRLFLKGEIPAARAAFEEAEGEALKVAEAIALSEVRVVFAFDPPALAAQRDLVEAHQALSRSRRIWDVLSSVAVDRVRERSAASSAIRRTPVALSTVSDSVVAGDQIGLRFQNANGADLDFFPGFLLMRQRGATDYALIDLRDVQLTAEPIQFIEDEAVPPDTRVIDHAWAKANRDGSPDRRFRDNRQIPVVLYGSLHFSSAAGLAEAYHVSDCERALVFASAFHRLQAALQDMARRPLSEQAPQPGSAAPVVQVEELPELPTVGGAHEVTGAAVATIMAAAVAVFAVQSGSTHRPPTQPAVAVVNEPTPTAPSGPPQPTPRPPEPSPSPTVIVPRPSTASLPSSGPPPRERLTVKQQANLRAGPDKGTTSIRVLAAGTALEVFARDGQWVQVGQTQPWGWMHSGVLRTVP